MHYLNSFSAALSFKAQTIQSIVSTDNSNLDQDKVIKQREAILSTNPFAQNEKGEYLFLKLIDMNSISLIRFLLNKKNISSQLLSLADKDGKGVLEHAQNDELKNLLKSRGAKEYNSNNYEDAKISSAKMLVETSSKVDEINIEKKETQKPEQTVGFFDSFEEVEDSSTTVENASIEQVVNTDTETQSNTQVPQIKIPEYKEYTHFEVNPEIKSLNDIIGMGEIKRELRENIIIPLKDEAKQELCKKENLQLPNGILLSAKHGTWSVVSSLVNETGLPALQIHSMQELEPIIKDVEKNYKENGIRTIVVATDFDSFYNENAYNVQTEKNKFVSLLKNCSKKGLLFIATTKDKSKMDDTFTCAGLLDKVLTLPDLSNEERQLFIQRKIENKQILSSLNGELENITKSTEGIPPSEIEKILNETARTAISRGELNDIMPIYRESLSKYTKEKDLTPINEFNRTSAYDTPEFKRIPITDKDPTIDDLGGMPEIKKQLNELYIKPMQKLDVLYKELGSDALPDGAIFYGGPGNGKTYTAKALAKTLGLPFYETKLSDIGTALVHEEGKAFKQRAEQLNKKFKETGERSVWFLDEFESLGGERGNAAQHNKELTDALLQELNNPAEKGFILIAATNDLDGVDSALKRRGRLGNWIHFNNPNFEERCDVIKRALLKSSITKELATDEFIKKLSEDFDGMSMSSITAILKDATRETIVTGKDYKEAIEICKDKNNERMIGEFCNKTGLKQHKYNEYDFKTLDELGGMEDVKQQLKESIIDVWSPEVRETLLANKRRLPGGVMLYGPPGTGKTTIVETLARQMNVPLYKMDYSSINDSQYIHQIAKHVVEIFDRLELEAKIQKKPVMLFFDEAERFFPSPAERHQIEEVNTYKDKMNNAAANGIILIGATNYIDQVNPEIVENPRRMGTKIEVGNPNENDRYNLLEKTLLDLPITAGVINAENCKELAKITDGWSIGKISDTIDKVITQAIKKKENIQYETMLEAFKKRNI